MRTTLDLPDAVFRRLKAQAALEGMSLKDLIARYVSMGLSAPARTQADRVSDAAPVAEKFVSVYDVVKDACGMVKGGPRDLASNPKHMEDFGREKRRR